MSIFFSVFDPNSSVPGFCHSTLECGGNGATCASDLGGLEYGNSNGAACLNGICGGTGASCTYDGMCASGVCLTEISECGLADNCPTEGAACIFINWNSALTSGFCSANLVCGDVGASCTQTTTA